MPARLADRPWRQQVFDEESGKLVAAIDPGLGADVGGMLAHSLCRGLANAGDLFQQEALRQQQGDILPGRRQPPQLELSLQRAQEIAGRLLGGRCVRDADIFATN